MVLTLIGWAYLAKSLAIFLFPDWGVRSMAAVQDAPVIKFRIAGIGLLALAVICGTCVAAGMY